MFETKILIPNELVLMQRKQSKFLYARYKNPRTGFWREKSTKSFDPVKAEDVARRFYYDLTVRVENNLPISTHSMDKVIDLYLRQLEREYHRGDKLSETNYLLKKRVTEKFIRPFFGKRFLHTINRQTLMDFSEWRRDYWVKQPSDAKIEFIKKNGRYGWRPVGRLERQGYAHLRDERAILNSLFRVAVTKGWIEESQVPKIDFRSDVIPKGRTRSKVKPDAFFTPAEYQRIKIEMAEWASRPTKFYYRRIAAYYYVMLCFTTGVRPGTAMDSVRWRDVVVTSSPDPNGQVEAPEVVKGLEFVRQYSGDVMDGTRLDIHVPFSKVGSYRSIGLNDAFWLFNDYKLKWLALAEELATAQIRRTKTDRTLVLPKWREDDPVFLLPNGYHLTGPVVSKYFKYFLEEAGLLLAPGSGDVRSLYSARHSFITYMQAQGVPDGLICEFTGTSLEMLKKHYSHQRAAQVGYLFKNYRGN